MTGAAGRVGAILMRHVYLWRGSWTRLFDLVYWPLLQVMVWGFMTEFLAGKSSWVAQAGGVFIGAVLLWDVLVRGQFGMTLSLLEEMWSRNFANLFVSPLRPWEFATALMCLSIARSLIGVVPAALAEKTAKGFTFLGVLFPTLGGAVAGIRYFGDFDRFAAISRVSAEKLDAVHRRACLLRDAPTLGYGRVADLAHAADEVVVSEIESWQAVFAGKHFTVPV